MRIRFVLAAIVVSLFYLTPSSSQAQDGELVKKSIEHDGQERSYFVYTPASYDGAGEWPLVLSYHGFSYDPNGQMSLSKMNISADSANYIIVYPVGLGVFDPISQMEGTGWNMHEKTLSEVDDVDFSVRVLEQVQEEYAVDPQRIHVTGWSMGAGMTFSFVCAHPEIVASFATVAETMTVTTMDNCNTPKPISFLHVHGTNDPFIPFNGINGRGIKYAGALELSLFWTDVNRCSTAPEVTELEDVSLTDNSTVVLSEYSNCHSGTQVHFYQVNGGGHTWPGGGAMRPGFREQNHDFSASDEILAFFSDNRWQDISVNNETSELPEEPALSVYPNPFTSAFTVELNVATSQHLRVTIYNTLGQEVARVTDQVLSPGSHQVRWHASDASLRAGLYLLEIQLDDQRITKPIIQMVR